MMWDSLFTWEDIHNLIVYKKGLKQYVHWVVFSKKKKTYIVYIHSEKKSGKTFAKMFIGIISKLWDDKKFFTFCFIYKSLV